MFSPNKDAVSSSYTALHNNPPTHVQQDGPPPYWAPSTVIGASTVLRRHSQVWLLHHEIYKSVCCVSVASPCKFKLFSIYLHLSRLARCLLGMVSAFCRLSRRLAILPPICELILRHFIASVHSILKLDLLIGKA